MIETIIALVIIVISSIAHYKMTIYKKNRARSMIKELMAEIDNAIFEALVYISKKDYISYILLIGRADIIPGLRSHVGTDCVIDYQMDRYYDETRESFYLHYLNRNYKRDGFRYEGESGIDDLSIEMMIYSHLWSSDNFLKLLFRLSNIVAGNGYAWHQEVPEHGFHTKMTNEVIAPLKDAGLKLGEILEDCYSSVIRNSFAKSLYTVDVEARRFTTRSNHQLNTYTFDEFQTKFLKSALLMNHLGNAIQHQHNEAAMHETAITKAFLTPEGVKVQVYGEMVKRGNEYYPEFRIYKIKE